MKDLSLKDRKGLPNERIYNKIQDFVWDEVLSKVRAVLNRDLDLSDFILQLQIFYMNLLENDKGRNVTEQNLIINNASEQVFNLKGRNPWF